MSFPHWMRSAPRAANLSPDGLRGASPPAPSQLLWRFFYGCATAVHETGANPADFLGHAKSVRASVSRACLGFRHGSGSPLNLGVAFASATCASPMCFRSRRDPEGIVRIVVVIAPVRVHIAEIVAVARIHGTQPPIDSRGRLQNLTDMERAVTRLLSSILHIFLCRF